MCQARRAPAPSVDAGQIPQVFHAGDLTICLRARPPAAAPTAASSISTMGAALATPLASGLSNVAAITAVATRESLPPRTLRLQLELLHLQLLAWTSAKYEAALIESPTLDPTDTLSGTQGSFEALLKRLSQSMDYVLQAAEMLPLPPLLRNAAATALAQVRCAQDAACMCSRTSCQCAAKAKLTPSVASMMFHLMMPHKRWECSAGSWLCQLQLAAPAAAAVAARVTAAHVALQWHMHGPPDVYVQAVSDADCVCGMIACGHQLVALHVNAAVPPHQQPHPWDLLILLNFIESHQVRHQPC